NLIPLLFFSSSSLRVQYKASVRLAFDLSVAIKRRNSFILEL
ncbi:unnamed protein product, partial [Arabidopsis halleri]